MRSQLETYKLLIYSLSHTEMKAHFTVTFYTLLGVELVKGIKIVESSAILWLNVIFSAPCGQQVDNKMRMRPNFLIE